MKRLLWVLLLTACTPWPDPTPPPATIKNNDTTYEFCLVKTIFTLTPAPIGETPFQKWKRTKADYERAIRTEQTAMELLREQTTGAAIGPYMDAEKELQAIECNKLCDPPGSKL